MSQQQAILSTTTSSGRDNGCPGPEGESWMAQHSIRHTCVGPLLTVCQKLAGCLTKFSSFYPDNHPWLMFHR